MHNIKGFDNFINEDSGILQSIMNFKGFDLKDIFKNSLNKNVGTGLEIDAEINPDDLKGIPTEFGKAIQDAVGVIEEPAKSNQGPEVIQYQKSTGTSPGQPWCMSFVYYIMSKVFGGVGKQNPLPKTASVIDHWKKTPTDKKISIEDVRRDPDKLKPGMIAIYNHHTGIVIGVDPEKRTFRTIEGNYADKVSIVNRKIDEKDLNGFGFTDYMKDYRKDGFDNALAVAANVDKDVRMAATNASPNARIV